MEFEVWKQRFIGAYMALSECEAVEAIELAEQYSATDVDGCCPVATAWSCYEANDDETEGDEAAEEATA